MTACYHQFCSPFIQEVAELTTQAAKCTKYADDTALVGLCTNTDTQYRAEVDRFVSWCYDNFLNLTVDKTKEIIIDYRRDNNEHNVLEINRKSGTNCTRIQIPWYSN